MSGITKKKEDYSAKIKKLKINCYTLLTQLLPANLNAKINEIKNEVPRFSSLATTTALNAVENKIPDVSTLAKKAEYNTKIGEIEKILDHEHGQKYITTQERNKSTSENFEARLKQANLATKTDIADFVKKDRF